MSCPVTSGPHGRGSDGLRMKTLVSRTSCILNSPELSDVKFIFKNPSVPGCTNGQGQVGGQDGETIIYGHKLILALASPVFHKMFYMDKNNQQFVTAGSSDEIYMDGHGFNAEAFVKFLEFLYTDQIIYKDLAFDLIVGILTCADYYDVLSLKFDCVDQLQGMITKENVIQIMNIAETFGERDLVEEALEFIDENLGSLVESEEILCIKSDTLFAILKRDSLDVDESNVLDLALKWAGKECKRRTLKATGENKREVLGKVFFEIRFALLTSDRISELIRSNMLSGTESLDVVLEVHTPGYVTAAGNSKSKRLRLAPEVGFKSNPRIFGQKKKLLDAQESEKNWKARKENFHYLKAKKLAKTKVDLNMRGFPRNKTEDEVTDEIERAKGSCVFDLLVVEKLDDGRFHVQFKYNSCDHHLTDLLDPAWYEFPNPHSILISECDDDDSDDDD